MSIVFLIPTRQFRLQL